MEIDVQDFAAPEHFCFHGQYVGNEHGADHMCGYCEDGISQEDYQAMVRREIRHQQLVNRRVRIITMLHQACDRMDAEKMLKGIQAVRRVKRQIAKLWGEAPVF